MNLAQASSLATIGAAAAATRRPTGRGLNGMAAHALYSALLLAMATSAHAAPPSGGVVTTGTATIDQTDRSTVVTQTTRNVSINWQDFSIGAGESVQFVQPGVDSIALNRVLGSNPSVILGSLTSNGRVFLLNPNGVLFGKGSSVNVGGLVASTMDLSDADFQAGNHAFTAPGVSARFSSPSPATSMVTASPAASATVPSRATITPSLRTVVPISAT